MALWHYVYSGHSDPYSLEIVYRRPSMLSRVKDTQMIDVVSAFGELHSTNHAATQGWAMDYQENRQASILQKLSPRQRDLPWHCSGWFAHLKDLQERGGESG